MTRTQARQVFRDLQLTGELYRGYTLIGLDRGEWRIPALSRRQFNTRQEARECVNERIVLRREMLMETMAG